MMLEPKCYTSAQRGLIWLLIPKNASSSIRAVLERPSIGGAPTTCAAVHADKWATSTVFAFLRDPIDRALSAYQEASLRASLDRSYMSDASFADLPDGEARFDAYLDRLSEGPWDLHVAAQTDIVGGRHVDHWGLVDHLETDLARILATTGYTGEIDVQHHRPRAAVIHHRGRDAVDYGRHDLTSSQLARITALYREDLELYGRVRDARKPG